MRQITTERAEQDYQRTSKENDTGETTVTGMEGQAVPDPKQEPGDNNDSRKAETSGVSGRDAAEEHGDAPSPVPDQETAPRTEKSAVGERAPNLELCEAAKSPAQGSLASSTDFAQEGSRVLKQEQREGGNASASPPADHTKTADKPEHGIKRRASTELTSSDGEPLSRMDSEDRFVGLSGGLILQHHAKFTALKQFVYRWKIFASAGSCSSWTSL